MTKSDNEVYRGKSDDTKKVSFNAIQEELSRSRFKNLDVIPYDPEAKPFKSPQEMKRAWRKMLDDELIPLENELR